MKFHKLIITVLSIAAGLTFSNLPASAQSKKSPQQYTIIKQHFGQELTWYRVKYPKKNVYGWNAKHTKKYFNRRL